MEPCIQAKDVSLTFRPKNREAVAALSELSLDVGKGEFVSIVGPSGCGKSTFLNILLGLIKPDTGVMQLNGTRIAGPGQERAMVFQEFGLLPWRTVVGNVELGLELKGVEASVRHKRAMELINMAGLVGFENHYPHELSGGMKQRVGLARALATDPEVLLMDEPFAALDAQTRDLMQAELLQVWERTKKTVIFVTHSIEEAAYLSDRVVVMSARPGRTKTSIRIDLPRPRDYEMRLSAKFNEIKAEIWSALKDELAGKGAGDGI
ncbi:MAG TPA: ABC transporter ATP-binding protein [Candidatus Binatia bacterium]|jgi:NitT/TauT family transport system ATP-binding protein